MRWPNHWNWNQELLPNPNWHIVCWSTQAAKYPTWYPEKLWLGNPRNCSLCGASGMKNQWKQWSGQILNNYQAVWFSLGCILSKIIFQIMPNCQDLPIFLPFSLFLKSVWWVLKGRKSSENWCWPCCLQSTTGLVAIPQETSDAAVSESARLENGRIMKRTEVKELRAGSPLGWHCLCAFGTQSVFQTHVSI